MTVEFIKIDEKFSSADYTEFVDLSDSEKEDIAENEITLLKNKLKQISHLNKLLTRYQNQKGKGIKNDLAISILSYMYDLYLKDGNDFYSVYHVFDSKYDFIDKVKEHTNYLGGINDQRISEAFTALRSLRCIKTKKCVPKNTKKFGSDKKYLVQIMKIKNLK